MTGSGHIRPSVLARLLLHGGSPQQGLWVFRVWGYRPRVQGNQHLAHRLLRSIMLQLATVQFRNT